MTLGIDVSYWQPTTPSLTGLAFLFARSTYGLTHDPMYATHIAHARAHGLLVGAYHFGVGDATARDQAAAFLAAAGSVNFYVLDLETNRRRPSMTQTQAREFIAAVQAKGHRIGLYHSDSGFPSLGQDYNWVAKWSATPPARTWAFWQYAGIGVDRDRFHGDLGQLMAFAGIHPTRFKVVISGYTPLYTTPNGARAGAVTQASYICSRSKVDGLWWYRILTASSGSPTALAGRYFKPNRNTKVTLA